MLKGRDRSAGRPFFPGIPQLEREDLDPIHYTRRLRYRRQQGRVGRAGGGARVRDPALVMQADQERQTIERVTGWLDDIGQQRSSSK